MWYYTEEKRVESASRGQFVMMVASLNDPEITEVTEGFHRELSEQSSESLRHLRVGSAWQTKQKAKTQNWGATEETSVL